MKLVWTLTLTNGRGVHVRVQDRGAHQRDVFTDTISWFCFQRTQLQCNPTIRAKTVQ